MSDFICFRCKNSNSVNGEVTIKMRGSFGCRVCDLCMRARPLLCDPPTPTLCTSFSVCTSAQVFALRRLLWMHSREREREADLRTEGRTERMANQSICGRRHSRPLYLSYLFICISTLSRLRCLVNCSQWLHSCGAAKLGNGDMHKLIPRVYL